MDDTDTDTLVALVSSLLEETASHTESEILDTLADHAGNVNAAADALNASRNSGKQKPTRKRRASAAGLDGWLNPVASNSKRKQPKPPSPRKSNDSRPMQLPGTPKSNGAERRRDAASVFPAKPVVDLMTVLRAPTSNTTGLSVPRLPPLTLSTPALIAQHTPCTLHASILPPELACRLFYAMIDLAQSWTRNKWWLFDRLVESPHRTSFFARNTNGPEDESWQEAAKYWYNGREAEKPQTFPPVMEEACAVVEDVVNRELRKRARLPLEWDGTDAEGKIWRANVAASNCYEGAKESVGFHSDQLTYLGPYPTIASISLGTSRIFRLREVIPSDETAKRSARTYNLPLPHNSLLIMHATTQERFKHTIPPQQTIDLFRPSFPHPDRPHEPPSPSNCRINITFRFYRPDYVAHTTPRCKCGIPAILRPDMKRRGDEGKSNTDEKEPEEYRYWWACNAGAQNEGKTCGMWKVMDVDAEGRGPFVRDRTKIAQVDVDASEQCV